MDIRSSYWHNDYHYFAYIAMQAAKVQQIRRDGNACRDYINSQTLTYHL